MAGVNMEDIAQKERANQYPADYDWLTRPVRKGTLEEDYFENHSLKSFYSSDFTKPAESIFSHVWDHYVPS